MKQRPILFSGDMVRAILEGRKTQTRRLVNPQPIVGSGQEIVQVASNDFWVGTNNGHFSGHSSTRFSCKFGQSGDQVWVKETFAIHPDYNPPYNFDGQYVYRATDPDWETTDGWKWKPSLFMPREASRIFLEITEVRVERLQDISENDAWKEGIEFKRPPINQNATGFRHYQSGFYNAKNAQHSYQTLWEKINGPESWDLNPWVWVVEFKTA